MVVGLTIEIAHSNVKMTYLASICSAHRVATHKTAKHPNRLQCSRPFCSFVDLHLHLPLISIGFVVMQLVVRCASVLAADRD